MLPVRVKIPCDIFVLLFLYQHFLGNKVYYLYTHIYLPNAGSYVTIYIKNYLLKPEKLALSVILICITHFIIAYFKSQIILFLLVTCEFLNAQQDKPVSFKKEVKPK